MTEEHKEHHGENHHTKHKKSDEHHSESKSSDVVKISKLTLWQIAAGVLGVLLIFSIITGGFTFNSETSNEPAQQAQAAQPREPSRPSADNTNLADDDNFLGPEDAKVVVVEFSDYECPYCAAAAGTYPALIERFKSQDPNWEPAIPLLKEYANQGKIKFVYRDFPLNIHDNAQKAAEAAECAGDQRKYWEMHDKLFEEGVSGGVSSFKKFASDLHQRFRKTFKMVQV
jgi:hypothetical protein